MPTPSSLGIETDLVNQADGRFLATLYLPEANPSNRWALETFRWLPSDATLAALPFPVVPDSDALVHGGPAVDLAGGPIAYLAQVVLADLPDEINLGSSLGYLAGGFTGARIRIKDKTLAIEVSLDRRLGVSGVGFTSADMAAQFPTVTSTDVDPDVTFYDARIAHP